MYVDLPMIKSDKKQCEIMTFTYLYTAEYVFIPRTEVR